MDPIQKIKMVNTDVKQPADDRLSRPATASAGCDPDAEVGGRGGSSSGPGRGGSRSGPPPSSSFTPVPKKSSAAFVQREPWSLETAALEIDGARVSITRTGATRRENVSAQAWGEDCDLRSKDARFPASCV